MTTAPISTRIVPCPMSATDEAIEALETAAAGFAVIATHTDSDLIRDLALCNLRAARIACARVRRL